MYKYIFKLSDIKLGMKAMFEYSSGFVTFGKVTRMDFNSLEITWEDVVTGTNDCSITNMTVKDFKIKSCQTIFPDIDFIRV